MRFNKIRIFEQYTKTMYVIRYDLADVPFETAILLDGRYEDIINENHNYINITIYVGATKTRFCIKDINNINYIKIFDNTNKKNILP